MPNTQKWTPTPTQPDNNDITTWALPDGAIARLGQGGMMGNITPSPDGKYLAVGSSIGVWLYDISTMSPVTLWDTGRGWITAVLFSPNGKWLATGNGDGLVRIWDVRRGVCVSRMERDEGEKLYHLVSHFAFSPDSQHLVVSSSRDYIIYVWHTETGEKVAKFHGETNFRWFSGSSRPIAFSPDGRLLACMMPDSRLFDCADTIGEIRTSEHSADFIAIWDMKIGERVACLTEPTDFVHSLSFSPCGQFLAAGSRDNTIHVWAVADWQLTQTYSNYDVSRIQVSHSQEGVLRATGASDNTIIVWDVESGEKHYTHQEARGNIQSAHFFNGNQLVFTTESDLNRLIKMWKIGNSKSNTFSYSSIGIPDSLVFSLDGKTLLSGCWRRKVMLWDITNPSYSSTRFNPPGDDLVVSASSVGKLHVFGPDGNTAKVWEVDNKEIPIATFTLPEQKSDPTDRERQVTSVAFAPTNNLLASADNAGKLYVLDVHRQNILHTLKAHNEWIHFIAFSPNEKQIVSITHYGPVSRMWNVESGEAIETFPDRTSYIAFSPCGTLVACGQREILLWDTKHHETVMTIPQPRDSWAPFALAFSPCSRYLASGTWWQRGVNTKKVAIRLWDVATGEKISTFRGHCSDVQELAFSPDGTLLASGGYDGTILLWDMKPFIVS